MHLQRIPAEVDLPPIVPASLVKPTPPGDLLKPTADEQQSMFTSVVPDNRWGRERTLVLPARLLLPGFQGPTDCLRLPVCPPPLCKTNACPPSPSHRLQRQGPVQVQRHG